MKKFAIVVLILPFLISCKALFSEAARPDGPIETQAAVEVTFQETIRTAIVYRTEQIEAQNNQALVGVDAGLITLISTDRVSNLLAPIHDEGRTMTLGELDLLITERDELLAAYGAIETSTSNSEKVTELFDNLKAILDGARVALGIKDMTEAENARTQALQLLRSLRQILAG